MKLPKLYAFNRKFKIDLSLSENPLGCSPRVLSTLRKEIKNVVEYPNPKPAKLTLLLARKFQVSEENILLGNGSESLIDLICRSSIRLKGEVILPELTFPLFERAIILANNKPIFVKMKKDFQIDLQALMMSVTKQTRLVIICNPNNPTGKVIDKSKLLEFVKSIAPIPVLVDEANIEFGGKSVVSEVRKNNNLMVLRTFSKGFGLAGLRVGILVGPRIIINKLKQFVQPFPLNSFVENAVIAALEDKKFIQMTRNFMAEERKFLTEELRKREFMVFNSEANNLLVEINRIFSSATQFVKLLNENDVSVINGKSFRGLGDRFIRISPRTRKTNIKFIKVIDKILSNME